MTVPENANFSCSDRNYWNQAGTKLRPDRQRVNLVILKGTGFSPYITLHQDERGFTACVRTDEIQIRVAEKHPGGMSRK